MSYSADNPTANYFHPVADIFPMMSDREYADLVQSVRENGLREPVWLHRDGRIIDGRNRWRACQETGVELVTRTYEGDDSTLVKFVLDLNLHRRHLDESQRGMVAARSATYSQGGDRTKPSIEGLTQSDAAELLNVSVATVERASVVLKRGVPELAAKVEAGELAVSTAAVIATAPVEVQREVIAVDDEKVEAGELAVSTAAVIATAPAEVQREVIAADDEKAIIRRAKEIQQQRKEVRVAEKAKAVAEIANRAVLPLDSVGPFPVLYVDPPWRYDFAEDTGRQIENQYPTMPLDDIKKLEVPAADDAVLFLWVTSPKLPDGFEVLDAWGFEYRTSMVWVKDRIGMGYYARQQHELLLVGKRGALPVPDPEDRPSSVIQAPRGQHSAKPDLVYTLIERMYPLKERVELFQRRPRIGWFGWGNQA